MLGIKRVEPHGLLGHEKAGQKHQRQPATSPAGEAGGKDGKMARGGGRPQRGKPGPHRVSLRAPDELLTDSAQEAKRTGGRRQQAQGGRNRTEPRVALTHGLHPSARCLQVCKALSQASLFNTDSPDKALVGSFCSPHAECCSHRHQRQLYHCLNPGLHAEGKKQPGC